MWSVVKKREASTQREAETGDGQRIPAGVESPVLGCARGEAVGRALPQRKIHLLLHIQ